MSDVIKKFCPTEFKSIDIENRTFWAVASTPGLDRTNDTIALDAWNLENFRKNPVIPWAHDYGSLPVAKAEDIRVEDGKLIFKAKFPPAGQYELADSVFNLYAAGILKAFSVGFKAQEFERNMDGGMDFKKVELLEISAVSVPANADALVMMAAKSLRGDQMSEEIKKEEKTLREELDSISGGTIPEMEQRIAKLEELIKQVSEDIQTLQIKMIKKELV